MWHHINDNKNDDIAAAAAAAPPPPPPPPTTTTTILGNHRPRCRYYYFVEACKIDLRSTTKCSREDRAFYGCSDNQRNVYNVDQ